CVVWEIGAEFDDRLADRAGSILRHHGRAADTFGRLEQNRFAVVAPGTGTVGAERLAERMRERLIELTGGDDGLVRSKILVVDEHENLPGDGNDLLERLDHALAA